MKLRFELPSGFRLPTADTRTLGYHYTSYQHNPTQWDNMLVHRLTSTACANGGPAYVLYVKADDPTKWWFVDRSLKKVVGSYPITHGTREEVLGAIIAAIFRSGIVPQGVS